MESKLPKPSMLKRPMTVTRNILPMDRIRPAAPVSFVASSSFANKSMHFPAPVNTFTHAPLTRDLTNHPNGVGRRGRAASPEMTRQNNAAVRPRLRRSQSACDIRDLRDMRPLKRTEITLAPIPAKSSRLMTASSTASSVTTTANTGFTATLPGNGHGRPNRFGNAAAATTAKKPAVSRVHVGSRGATTTTTTAIARKPATSNSSTSISTTGAGKPINKRIPPYDFKARYNDLLEKHKVLKAKYEEKCEQVGSLENMPEQLEESQAQLYIVQEQLKNSQTECECLHEQVKSQNIKIDSISCCLVKTKEELEQINEEHKHLKAEHKQLSVEVVELRERVRVLSAQNEEQSEELFACKEQLFHSNLERKELHNTIMDLRGNIRVFCRVRPPLESEQDKHLCTWNYIDESTVEVQNPDLLGKNKQGSHTFSFDHVFHSNSRQEDIFEMVSPLIQSALDGYNVCIFAYGQTGSGKTYTMDGIPSNAGVIPRTVDLLFDSVKNYKRLGWEYEIKVTFLEIYNEVLYDLLSNEQKDMEIRMVKNNKNDIYVSNITEERVMSAKRLRELMQVAKMNRATAATAGNERSSRSHAVTKIELIGYHAEKYETSIGTINLVDLAGSESPKTSVRMNETKNINRSLSELTNVILALLQKQDHIPYRNSKLTHLLMPSLGGNSKTLMFINVAPFLDCFVESVKSLRFAASVNSCKMAKARRNRFLNTSSSSSFEK